MRYLVRFIIPTLLFLMVFQNMGNSENGVLDLGLSAEHYQEGDVPAGWKLRKFPGKTRGASAHWVKEAGIESVKLHSKANLTFMEKKVDIDISEYRLVSWRWKVENILFSRVSPYGTF